MRPRKKKHCAERLEKLDSLFFNPESFFTDESKKISLEIGCGKGGFICETARKHPERYFVGIEKVPDVLVMAMEKAEDTELGNISFLSADAAKLSDILPEGCVTNLYLNFSDPWPKKRHTKRRLTHGTFLEIYKKILAPCGLIEMKTDNDGLFDFSLSEIEKSGFLLKDVCRDLPPEGLDGENVITEYENNFRSVGKNINYLRAEKKY